MAMVYSYKMWYLISTSYFQYVQWILMKEHFSKNCYNLNFKCPSSKISRQKRIFHEWIKYIKKRVYYEHYVKQSNIISTSCTANGSILFTYSREDLALILFIFSFLFLCIVSEKVQELECNSVVNSIVERKRHCSTLFFVLHELIITVP